MVPLQSASTAGRIAGIIRLSTALVLLAAAPATAQSAPEDCGVTGSPALLLSDDSGSCAPAPIVDTEVTIAVTGIIARARVTQKFYNPGAGWVEGVYVFPLPDGAAVDHLRMFIGNRIIEGQIRERGAARADYEAARRAGVKASLVEQQRPNVFTSSVANIGPDETVEIVLELQDVVRYDSGEFRLRFPTVVAPRAGAADSSVFPNDAEVAAAGDADPLARLTSAVPRALEPVNFFSMEIDLDPGFAIRSLYSPTHAIETNDLGGNVRLVCLRAAVDPADRDFVLAWTPQLGAEPTARLFSERLGDEIYALLMMVPPSSDNESGRFSRELLLVIDTSGSMVGASIEQAKIALLLALDQLRPGDWFNVVEFNTAARRLFPASVVANPDHVEYARAFVDGLQADGGTNIAAALEQSLDAPPAPAELRQVVFITDGAVGNEAELFTYIGDHLGDSRLFTVGIGAAPNAHFMRKAAEFGRGTFTFVDRPEAISATMDTLFAKLEQPVLADVAVDWGDPEADSWPSRVPDLYAGEPLVVTARLAEIPAAVGVRGRRDGATWSTELAMDAERDDAASEKGVGKLWARRKIEGLMDGLALGDARDAVRNAVVSIGLEHHLVTPFTSLIAVDVTPSAPGDAARTRLVPLNPAGAGALPRTGTPSSLHALIAAALLFAGLALRPRDEEPDGE